MGVRSTGSQHPTTTEADGHLLEYFRQNFSAGGAGTNAPDVSGGLTASGGVISDYTDPGPGSIYRTHVFTSSGAFNVTALGALGDTIDYVIIGGGGGGAAHGGSIGYETGGGGAGAFIRQGVSSTKPVSVQSYPIVIGLSLIHI